MHRMRIGLSSLFIDQRIINNKRRAELCECLCVCVCVCEGVCLCVLLGVCMYACMYVCMYVCMSMYPGGWALRYGLANMCLSTLGSGGSGTDNKAEIGGGDPPTIPIIEGLYSVFTLIYMSNCLCGCQGELICKFAIVFVTVLSVCMFVCMYACMYVCMYVVFFF